MDIYVVSDHHFYHKNIIKYDSLPYSSMEDMISDSIKKWNSIVGNKDIVIHLGDFSFGSKKQTKAIVDKLNGKRKILVMGNHDRSRSTRWWKDVGFDVVFNRLNHIEMNLLGLKIILSHEPISNRLFDLNIHGHTHDNTVWTSSHVNICGKYRSIYSLEHLVMTYG